MKTTRLSFNYKFLFLCLIFSSILFSQQSVEYTVVDIGTFGISTEVWGINAKGHVVGSGLVGNQRRGFIWRDGIMTDLGTLGGNMTIPRAINDSDVVTGDSWTINNRQHAFRWEAGSMTDLGSLGGNISQGFAINDSGVIVGQSLVQVAPDTVWWDAFIWRGGMIGLGIANAFGEAAYANGINNSGKIIGNSLNGAWILDGSVIINLGELVNAHAINDSGAVVGDFQTLNGNAHAFLWKNGIMIDLGVVPHYNINISRAYSINSYGEIVGNPPFIYKNGQMMDLQSLIDPSTGWTLSAAYGINDSGMIAGIGILNGQPRAYLLIPKRYPVLIVPGIAGTYASDVQNDLGWIMNRGVPPEQLQIDPLARVYDDVITTLENKNYEQGKDLFVVNYDWRVLPGPVDNNINGHIEGLTASSITSGQFNYGVDYLGWYLKQACEKWREKYNEELDSVDVICHSTGGLVTRAYIQSDAYGGIYDPGNNYKLPVIRNFIMIGVPNRGASKAWNPLHDSWVSDIAYRFVLSKILNCAYQKILNGSTVTGPDYNINLASILDSLGNPDKVKFINKYVPTIRGLLSTYDFINFGNGVTNVNTDAAQRNTYVLDLNNGYDLYPGVDPNGFLDLTKASVIYGTGQSTFDLVEQRDDFETNAIQSFTDWTRTTVWGGTIWYRDLKSGVNNGDGTVPTISSAGQFLNDSRAKKYPFAISDHTGMVSTVEVQSKILDILNVDYEQQNISTGSSTNISNVLSVICDPVESFVTDGNGNRLGYSNATGPLAEIPNSIWYGNTDGRGWVFGSVQEPINLQITGLGEDYYVMVSVEDTGYSGGVALEGFLGLGEVINYQITLEPLSVDQINSIAPDEFALAQNYPNPFNPSTKIRYSIPNIIASETQQSANVTLKVFDVLGNEVATLVNEYKPAGKYEIKFDAAQFSSGVYFYKLQAGSFVETKKMILLR